MPRSDPSDAASATDPATTEVALLGGLGSGGAVVRVGSTVRRPIRAQSAAVRSFLQHLEEVGFQGAPRVLGTDDKNREILTFMDGDVALPPFPAWAANEDLLLSVAELQRDLHTAARSFRPPVDAPWDRANLPASGADAVVCHNDLCLENVVVRNGRAVAFIDFDFAAPGSTRFDIAIAARHWVPIRDPLDLAPDWEAVDQVQRFRAFCDAHRLGASGRAGVVDDLGEFLDRALVSMRQRAEAGAPMYVAIWAAGYPEQNRRSRAFLDRQAGRLIG